MITKKEFLQNKIDDCQSAIWWNEIVLERLKELGEPKDKIDATEHHIKVDTETMEKLKLKINEIDN